MCTLAPSATARLGHLCQWIVFRDRCGLLRNFIEAASFRQGALFNLPFASAVDNGHTALAGKTNLAICLSNVAYLTSTTPDAIASDAPKRRGQVTPRPCVRLYHPLRGPARG